MYNIQLTNIKSNNMKKIIYLMVSIALTSISLLQCKKKDISDCGCNSPAIQTVDSVSGTLYFDSSLKEYYIISGIPGLQSKLYICDSTFSQLQSIVRTPPDHVNSSYGILFSGNMKNYCKSDTLIYLDFMYNIQLTNIKKQ